MFCQAGMELGMSRKAIKRLIQIRGVWLAQLVEQATLDFKVVSLSPILGGEIT